MVTTNQLVTAVCAAVKALKEAGGSNPHGIESYVSSLYNNNKELVNSERISKAIKVAVSKDLLKETEEGKYRLNVEEISKKEMELIDRANDDIPIIDDKCCPRRRRRRPSCRRRRRSCRRKRRCITRRRRSCPRKRRSCPRKRRRSCRRRKRSCIVRC